MDYNELFQIAPILENDINNCIHAITQYQVLIEDAKEDKKTLSRIVKSPEIINNQTLNTLASIIKRNNLPIVMDRDMFAILIGGYYVEPTPVYKAKVEDVFQKFHSELRNNIVNLEEEILKTEKLIRLYEKLKTTLDNLLNYTDNNYRMAISGENLLNALLRYISYIPESVMSNQDKTKAVYQLNLVNLEALQRKENLVNSNNEKTDSGYKPFHKVKFEKDNSLVFDEINLLIEQFNNMSRRLDRESLNKIDVISNDIDTDIINDNVIKKVDQYISDIMANFDHNFYLRYSILKKISEWHDIFLNSNLEEDYKAIFMEMQELVSQYNEFVNSLVEEETVNKEDEKERNLLYLTDEASNIIGIEQINKDAHEYQESDYRDLFKAFDILRKSDREYISNETLKVKGAGIPGVSESKFRRLRVGTSRVIFIDLFCLIDDNLKKYLLGIGESLLVITFGQKAGEFNIYNSVSSPKIVNLLKDYQAFINNELLRIAFMSISEKEKIAEVTKFVTNLVSQGTILFDESIENARGYIDDKGGPKND